MSIVFSPIHLKLQPEFFTSTGTELGALKRGLGENDTGGGGGGGLEKVCEVIKRGRGKAGE